MVPNVAGKGNSFRGAALYYLHDKRQEGEAVRLTTERVAWSETRNLSTDDPELAWRIMAATALDQDRLKAQAGVKNTGRKSDASVYAYSIAWHPEEKDRLSRAEMVRAANESILAIGAQDLQAIIVAHRDEPHPHVHVLINRVSPRDGRMMGTSNDFKKLDAWALAYRQARGEERKYCPARAEKRDAIQQGLDGADVAYVRGARNVPRSMVGDFAAAKVAANDNDAGRELARQSALSRKLAQDSRKQRDAHGRQWSDLSASYAAKKAQIVAAARQARDRATAETKEQFRPAWRDLYHRQWKEERAFKERETRLFGKINNALDAVSRRRELDPDNSRGFVAAAFNFLTSAKAREEAFAKRQKLEQRKLASTQKKEIDRSAKVIAGDRTKLLGKARKAFMADREALIVRQDADRSENRAAWKQRGLESKRAFARLRHDGKLSQEAKVERAAEGDKPTRRDRFNEAADGKKRIRGQRLRRRRDRGTGETSED